MDPTVPPPEDHRRAGGDPTLDPLEPVLAYAATLGIEWEWDDRHGLVLTHPTLFIDNLGKPDPLRVRPAELAEDHVNLAKSLRFEIDRAVAHQDEKAELQRIMRDLLLVGPYADPRYTDQFGRHIGEKSG